MSDAAVRFTDISVGFLHTDACVPVGTDLRKAVFDGFPPERAIGVDLLPAFIELGHKLWGDQETSSIKFIAGDLFQLPETPSSRSEPFQLSSVSQFGDLVGRVKYLFTGSVFHLFNEGDQIRMARKVAGLIIRKPGSIIFGRHSGAEQKGVVLSHRVCAFFFVPPSIRRCKLIPIPALQ